MWIALDIETIPNQKANEYFDKIKQYRAPANYTDPTKIEEYIAKQKIKDISKAGLHWWTGQIICICLENVLNGNTVKFYEEKNEKKLLKDFLTFLKKKAGNKALIGKNGKDFDLPFIKGRILHHDLGFIDHFRHWGIRDVDEIFSTSRSCGQITNLNTYAFGLGLDLKDLDGSMIFDMWKEDKHEEIQEYCAYDTFITAEMLRRYAKDFKI